MMAGTFDGKDAILETPRLWLREMHPEDVAPLLRVFGDALTMQHYPAPLPVSR